MLLLQAWRCSDCCCHVRSQLTVCAFGCASRPRVPAHVLSRRLHWCRYGSYDVCRCVATDSCTQLDPGSPENNPQCSPESLQRALHLVQVRLLCFIRAMLTSINPYMWLRTRACKCACSHELVDGVDEPCCFWHEVLRGRKSSITRTQPHGALPNDLSTPVLVLLRSEMQNEVHFT